MEHDCLSLEAALAELERTAPGVPLLALGQTVLWDEPMKAGVALLAQRAGRKFVAGVHDTDYFAKLPSGPRKPGQFAMMPHNSTSTKGLWSAAAEFSSLFGGETVIRKQDFQNAGTRLEKVTRSRPKILDEMTEAYGWRGVVSLDDNPPITRDLPLAKVFPTLQSTLNWAIQQSLDCLAPDARVVAEDHMEQLWKIVCDAFEQHDQGSLTEFYRAIIPGLYGFVAGEEVDLDAVSTSELLRFNTQTAHLPRFDLVGRFIAPETRATAEAAYNRALEGSEIYGLDRFGVGALPFDLVIPGKGRGTLRVGTRGIVIMTPKPEFITLKKPISTLGELAAAIEGKFGPDCVLIGKAVTLIGQLSREFVFVFHEGASSYVKYTRLFHENLESAGLGLTFHPILRVRYAAWDALESVPTWFQLPKPFQLAYGADEVCAPSFASRWRTVAQEQLAVLSTLKDLRRPVELIGFLDQHVGGAWNSVAREYGILHQRLEGHLAQMEELKARRRAKYVELRQAKAERVAAERAKGDHFRAAIFEQAPRPADEAKRKELNQAVDLAIARVSALKNEIRHILHEQDQWAARPEIQDIHERRRALELEAELKRMRLIRHAIICTKGLKRAGERPSAWWFPLVSPNGLWFRETIKRAEAYFEPLSPAPILEAVGKA